MKNKKYFVSALLVTAALVTALSACGKPASTSTNSSEPEPSTSSSVSDSTSSLPASSVASVPSSSSTASSSQPASSAPASNFQPTPSDASGEPVGEQSFTGTISDLAMGEIYITSDEGQTIPFPYTDALTANLSDTRPGTRVTVYYTGKIIGADTSGITILRFVNAK